MKKIIAILSVGLFAVATSCTPKTSTTSGPKYSANEKLTEGKTIFENSCGKCHDLPDPKSHSEVEWVGIMNAMAPKAKLNSDQHQIVYDYIISVK